MHTHNLIILLLLTICMLTPISQAVTPIPDQWTDSIIANYKFNESSGNAIDYFKGLNNGVTNGAPHKGTAPTAIDASFNWSYNMAVIPSFINVTSISGKVLNATGALSFWAYPTSLGDNDFIFGAYDGAINRLYVQAMANGTLLFGLGGVGDLVYIDIPQNKWSHWVFTWNNSVWKVYRNGTISSQGTYTDFTSTAWGGHSPKIGCHPDDTTMKFLGYLDDFAIFNSTLTAGDAANIYAGNFTAGGGADTTAPGIALSNNASHSMGNETVNWTFTITDAVGLSSWKASYNTTGTWANFTINPISGVSYTNSSYNATPLDYPNYVCMRLYANDTSNNIASAESCYNVYNDPPNCSITGVFINDISQYFSNATNRWLYSNGTINFQVNISDKQPKNYTLKIYNSTGALLKNTSGTSPLQNVSYGMSTFVEFNQSNFNFSLSCFDTYSQNGSEFSRKFNFTDITIPTTTGISNMTLANSSMLEFNVTFYDENFFGFNVTCNSIGGGVFLSSQVLGINEPSYFFHNATIIQGNLTCTWRYCDGHTGEGLKRAWDTREYNNGIEFRIGSKISHSLTGANISARRDNDRYSFTLKLNEPGRHTLLYTAYGPLTYLPSAKYPAWLVDWTSGTWFDMDSRGISDVKVFLPNETTAEISFMASKSPDIEISSIGELNCETRTTYIWVTLPREYKDTELRTNVCPETTAGILLIAVIFAMLLSFIWLNESFLKLDILNILIGIGFIFLGYVMFGCYNFFGILLYAMGIMLIVYIFLRR